MKFAEDLTKVRAKDMQKRKFLTSAVAAAV